MTLRPLRDLVVVGLVAFLGLGWWFFAPTSLGGKTSYAVIYGISMEPKFHRGDLVVLRKQGEYHVGEIVGYHSQQLHRAVLHRIVAMDGDRFVFQGDNNNFRDPEHPTADQLFGREWMQIPGIGRYLENARSPKNAAIIGAVAAFILLAGGGANAKRRRRPRRAQSPFAGAAARAELGHVEAPGVAHAAAGNETNGAAPDMPPAPPARPQSKPLPTGSTGFPSWVGYASLAFVALGLASLTACAVIAGIAYSRPLERVVTQTNLYTHRGHFDYSARASTGPVYDHASLHAGDPLFLNFVHDVEFKFLYHVTTKQPAQLTGDASLDAYLTDGSGWRRHLSLQPSQLFKGTSAVVGGHLSLDSLENLRRKFEAATGSHSLQYKLQLIPRVQLHGVVGTEAVNDLFAPTFDFNFTPDRLVLLTDDAGSVDLDPSRSGTGTTRTPQAFGPLGHVSEARHAAMIGIPLSLVLVLLGGFIFMVVRGNDEVAAIQRRYGPWMIDVAPAARPAHVERHVESIDALARIAERYERLIMHEQRGHVHSFLVEDDGIVYRYDAQEKHAGRADDAPPPAEPEHGWHEPVQETQDQP